jgi:hypothetical protein
VATPTPIDWKKERVLLTGGAGFLGGYVTEKLRERGCKDIVAPRSSEYDLVEMEAVKRLYADARPTLVLHLAARVGGIGANQENPLRGGVRRPPRVLRVGCLPHTGCRKSRYRARQPEDAV